MYYSKQKNSQVEGSQTVRETNLHTGQMLCGILVKKKHADSTVQKQQSEYYEST